MFLAGAVGSSRSVQKQEKLLFRQFVEMTRADWGLVSSFSKAHEHWKTTYICWNRECQICLSAYGKCAWCLVTSPKQQHIRRSGDPRALLKSGKESVILVEFLIFKFFCVKLFFPSSWCLSFAMFYAPSPHQHLTSHLLLLDTLDYFIFTKESMKIALLFPSSLAVTITCLCGSDTYLAIFF